MIEDDKSKTLAIPRFNGNELTELGITLLGPVMSLVNWANTNKVAISEAHRRFDEVSEPERISVQGVIYQRR